MVFDGGNLVKSLDMYVLNSLKYSMYFCVSDDLGIEEKRDYFRANKFCAKKRNILQNRKITLQNK